MHQCGNGKSGHRVIGSSRNQQHPQLAKFLHVEDEQSSGILHVNANVIGCFQITRSPDFPIAQIQTA